MAANAVEQGGARAKGMANGLIQGQERCMPENQAERIPPFMLSTSLGANE